MNRKFVVHKCQYFKCWQTQTATFLRYINVLYDRSRLIEMGIRKLSCCSAMYRTRNGLTELAVHTWRIPIQDVHDLPRKDLRTKENGPWSRKTVKIGGRAFWKLIEFRLSDGTTRRGPLAINISLSQWNFPNSLAADWIKNRYRALIPLLALTLTLSC